MVLAALALAGCAPGLGARPAMPTAIAGLSAEGTVAATPGPRPTRTPSGPTSTPAPWATPAPTAIPAMHVTMPHDIAYGTDCLDCHHVGMNNLDQVMPPDHKRRTNGECLGCHVMEVKPTPALVSHVVAGREACLTCHLQGNNNAPIVPGDHAGRMNDSCLGCHPDSAHKTATPRVTGAPATPTPDDNG